MLNTNKPAAMCKNKISIFQLTVFVVLFSLAITNQAWSQNLGFEATPAATPPANWTAVTGTWTVNTTPNFVRTGVNSMTITDPATTGTTIGTVSPFVTTTTPGYLITIGWGKSNTANNALFHLGYRTGTANTLNPTSTASGQPANLNDVTWSRIVSVSASGTLAANSYGASLRAFRSASTAGTTIYIDDIIMYPSASNVPDLTAPNFASNVFFNVNNITWINGTDNGAPASGIGGVVIVRTDGSGVPAPTLNDQAMYDPVNGEAGVGSFVQGGNTWKVVANIQGGTTTSFTDLTAGAGPYTYAVFMRDMAYNYSTGVSAIPLTACTNPPTPGTTVAFPSTPVCPNAPVTLNLSGGSAGTGQTVQWQSSTTLAGTYTNIGTASTSSSLLINPATTLYYRAEIICSGGTPVYSTPIQVVVSAGFSGTYTINSALATGGTNFQTFAAAIAAMMQCGINGPVVFNVDAASGPYNEQVILPVIPGTSASNTITFNGNGRTISDNSGTTTDQRAVIKLDGADYVTFNNFVINTGAGTYGYGVQLLNDADNNTINNCTITTNNSSTSTTNYAGVLINSTPGAIITAGSSLCDNNTISGNTITGGYMGIGVIANGSTSEVNNNSVVNNIVRDFYLYGIYLNGNNNTLVEGNNISRPARTTISEFRGIYLTANSRNTKISKNRIHNPFDGNLAQNSICLGINLNLVNASAGNENIISNNIIYDMISNQTTANMNGILVNNSTFAKIVYNTIVLDHAAAVVTTGGTRGVYVQAPVATNGLEFKNNIIVISRGGAGPKQAIYFENSGITLSSNNNDLYMASTTGTVQLGFANGNGYTTLALWQAGTGQDAASVSADPLFISPGTGDFMPTAPVLNNIGVPIPQVTTDINNVTRNATNPDPGAVEFTISGCVSPPTPGTAQVNNTPVCQNSDITLTLTGNSLGTGQTYVWETSPTLAGTYTAVSGPLVSPAFTTTIGASGFYRAAVTCGGNTQYSDPVEVIVIPGLAGPYTINSAAPASATNFPSFAAALNALSCGITASVTFNVDPASGPYNEQLIITPVAGASASKTITFNGNGRTLSFLSTNTNQRAVIKLDGAKHFTFNDLIVTAEGTSTTEYGYGFQLMNSADSNVINNCTININTTSTSTTNYAGIVVSASATSPITTGTVQADFNTFSNNTITGGYYGITLVSSGTAANFGNRIINNTIKDFYLTGIYVNGSGSTLIQGNDISRPNRASVSTFNGIYFTALSVQANVTGNRIHTPFGGDPTSTSVFNGIYFTAVDALSGLQNVVSNNLIYNIEGGSDHYGLYNSSSDNVHYFHNTISLDGPGGAGTASDFTRGFHQVTAAAGIELRNNIITITRNGPSQKTALYFSTAITGTNEILSDRNDLYLNSAGGTQNTGYINGTAYATLNEWRTASGQDANSVASNPIYTDVNSGNYKPTNASIDNRGLPVGGITVDINGDPRSATTPDIGAYEFTPAVCVAPPVAGAALVSQSPVCVDFPVQLSLTGNSVGLTQTYQWQTSTVIGGPYTNIGNVISNPDTTIIASSTFYYRASVTCGGNTLFSTPVLVTVTPGLPGGTYVIDQTNGPGTDFLSFNEAKAAMQCGIEASVVFNVAPGSGPYLEQLILDSIPGTSATKTVTFNGNGETIQFASTNTNERAVIKLNSTDYVGFYNLVINAQGTTTSEYAYGVQMLNNADNNTVNNCTININTTSTSTTNYAGVLINNTPTSITGTGDSRCDNNTISFNQINGGYAGVAIVANGTTAQVSGNLVFNNTIRDFYTYGIYLNGTAGAIIEGNDISRPARTTLTTFYGVYVTAGGRSLRIAKNRIHNPFDGNITATNVFYGIYFTGVDAPSGSENIISNNAIYNVNNQSDQYGFYNSSSDNVWFYHNTISFDFEGGTFPAADWSRGIYQITAASGLRFRNNIITIRRVGLGTRHAIYMAESGTTYVSDNNNFYVEANGGGSAYVGYNGANQATLANWQTSNTPNQDMNSLSVDPLYTLVSSGNLKPNFAPLDDKGAPVGITNDIVNAPRSSATPDIGAWEFSVQPCVVPPVAGTATAVPNSGVCIGALIQLSLSGNSAGAGQTYQWEYSTSSTGPWLPLGSPMLVPDTVIEAAGVFYYRGTVTCGGNTVSSTPVLLDINPPFPGGVYTIDKTVPTNWPATGTNFNSFAEAVAVMECGIGGKVTFNVAPNTYTEQIRMHRINGTSAAYTVTFQSQNGDPSSVTLTYTITDAAKNYVLQLDSASYIIFRDMTIVAGGTTNARAIELARTASNDTLTNLSITVPTSTSTGNTVAGIVGTALTGNNNVISKNSITNGSAGIYIVGSSVALAPDNLVIDSNVVTNSYYYNIYTSSTKNVKVTKNIVEMASPRNATAYGIYGTNSDSAYVYKGNTVNMNNIAAGTSYGIYLTSADAAVFAQGAVANNKVTALTGNTGVIYGIYQTATTNNSTVNNVVVINTTGASSYGLYSTGGGLNKYYNNSVNSVATSATNNYAAYFANTSGSGVDVRNNIFSHKAGGRAMYVGNSSYVYSDYNMLYTTGATLVQSGTPAGSFATLAAWRNASSLDPNSIVYSPAFSSTTNLMPNINDPESWAIHGRGEQIPGNDYDFNNSPRPTTIVAGVPDLGAYEFLPTIAPPVLPATPATPAPNTTQVFMFGTDTVSKITWKPASTVPSVVSVRRYSGVTPPGMAPTAKYMYFYTDVDVTAGTAPLYDLKQYYIDPWQGLMPREAVTRLGRTDAAGTWVMDSVSTVDTIKNFLSRDTLVFLDKFTGMTDSTVLAPPPPPNVISIDSSNKGTRFWVGYGHHYGFSSNTQDMVLYLSAEQAANVQVKVNGTSFIRNYSIPANTVKVSDIMPKSGLVDARLVDEGLFSRGISITSDVPIVAYAHIYDGANSGAGMLLPVGVYGYEYKSLNSTQYYPTGGAGSYSWFYVIADRDSTQVEITPSVMTKGGRPAGVPFTVWLNKGEIYNVMGTQSSGGGGTDISGSSIKSIPNNSGVCYPIAVFSGSSRTAICNTTNGDNMIQQVFPNQAWGKKYLTFATANSASNTTYYSNIWRVMVQDPTTVVMRNGVQLPLASLVTPGNYYQFSNAAGSGASTASYIEADKPVMVAQYMVSSDGTGCPGVNAPGGNGDPELIYISPIEQGIKKAVFYNTDESAITSNYINVVIPTNGLTSLKIDGATTFTDVFAHPALPGYSCVRHNLGGVAGQHIIESDSAFNAITYGLGSVESYGYNAGTLVKNLRATGAISNVFGSGSTTPYTCKGTPFRFSIRLSVKPTRLEWQFSQLPGLSPSVDSIQTDPLPHDSALVNGQWYYDYIINQDFVMNTVGTFTVPVLVSHPSLEGCSNSQEFSLLVEVIPAPVTDFTFNFPGCVTSTAQFDGSGTTSNGVPMNNWTWNFGDNTSSNVEDPTKQWAAAGVYTVSLVGIAQDGCIDTATKDITVSLPPVVDIVPDSLAACNGGTVTFAVNNPAAGVVYNWYDAPTAGTLVHTGNSYTVSVTGPVSYYVEGFASGCASTTRKKVTVALFPNLTIPVVVVDSAGADMIRFRWNAVTGATGYEISTDNGSTWTTPSSGLTGITHTVTGLQVGQTVSLIVRALGGCLPAISLSVTGQTVTDQVYIPNTFTPNNDGLNDQLRVYSNVVREMRFMIFNQWGEKIFESRSQSVAWDGTHNGKPQPSGVYMYVCDMLLADGSRIQRKGSINLVR